MKSLFKIVFFLLCVHVVNAQEPAGSPTINSPGWAKYKWLQGRVMFDNLDTLAFTPRFAGTTLYRPQDGYLYYYDSVMNMWQKLSVSSDIPITIYTGNGIIPSTRTIDFQNTGQMVWQNMGNLNFSGPTAGADIWYMSSNPSGLNIVWNRNNARRAITMDGSIINGGMILSTNGIGSGNNTSFRLDTLGRFFLTGMKPTLYDNGDSVLLWNAVGGQLKYRNLSFFASQQALIDSSIAIRGDIGTAINNENIGSGFRVLSDPSLQTLRTLYNSNTVLWDSLSNADGLTAKVDTSIIATQYDLTQIAVGVVNNTNTGAGFRVLSDPTTQTLRTLYADVTGAYDSSSNIGGLTYKIDTSIVATLRALKDSVFLLLNNMPVISRIEFTSGGVTNTYQNDTLIGKNILTIEIQGYSLGFTPRNNSAYISSFDPGTGTLILSNGIFDTGDFVRILFRSNPIYMIDANGWPIKDSNGNYIILN